MECEYKVLPSGRTIQISDIIYVSGISEMCEGQGYSIKITWASGVTKTFHYISQKKAEMDLESIKKLLILPQASEQMILS